MGYDSKKLYEQAIEIASEDGIYFIEDVITLLPCSKPTFYEHFPIDSNELNNIKDELGKGRVQQKQKMRKDWSKSKNSAETISLYKLICSQEERDKLNMNKVDVTTGGKEIDIISIIQAFHDKGDDQTEGGS